jgi:hypothetical protein
MSENQFKRRGLTPEEKEKILGEAYRIGYKFARDVFELFPGLIKSVVLFGSMAKATPSRGSDIDILIIVDDTSIMPERKFIDWYNLELAKLIRKSDPRLHVTTVTLTAFWENILIGEPVAINVLRYGVALIDTGYFEPLQFLLAAGRIRPTKEAIYNALTRAPWHLTRANSRILAGIVDLYWVMIDSAHAALMAYGKVPPSPEHIEGMLMDTFVKNKMLAKKYVNYYREVWKTSKAIVHGEIIRGNGIDFDRYREMAEDFEGKMRDLVKKREKSIK